MRRMGVVAAGAVLAMGALAAPAAADNGVDDYAKTAAEAAQMASDFASSHQGCLGPLRSAIARGELAEALGVSGFSGEFRPGGHIGTVLEALFLTEHVGVPDLEAFCAAFETRGGGG